MSFRNSNSRSLIRYTYNYFGEDFYSTSMPADTPILAYGNSSYSDSKFGFHHFDKGTISHMTFICFPTSDPITFTVYLSITSENHESKTDNITFHSSRDCAEVNIPLLESYQYGGSSVTCHFVSSTLLQEARIRIGFIIKDSI